MQSAIPHAAIVAVRSRNVDEAGLIEQSRSGRSAAIRVWQGGGAVVVVAPGEPGRRINSLEVAGRKWAHQVGVATPDIWAYAPDGSWLVGEWASVSAPSGPDYVRRALAVADRVMQAPSPPVSIPAQSWRSDRRGRVLRIARVVAAGMNPREFVAARQQAEQLPPTATAHGDYYFRNVLNASPGIRVVDWEFAGTAAAFTDHLRFWSTIKGDEDRRTALELILADRTPQERSDIGVLGRWLAFRLFAENVSAPRHLQNAADRTHAHAGLARGRELYRSTRG